MLDSADRDNIDEDRDAEENARGRSVSGTRTTTFPCHFSFQLRTSMETFLAVTRPARLGCWLYNHVALSTIAEPRTNVKVILKSNRATEARNEMTMLNEVANPLRILSEYLMTKAVTKPPTTWIETVAQAQGPKLLKREENQPALPNGTSLPRPMRMGARAGSSEKSDS